MIEKSTIAYKLLPCIYSFSCYLDVYHVGVLRLNLINPPLGMKQTLNGVSLFLILLSSSMFRMTILKIGPVGNNLRRKIALFFFERSSTCTSPYNILQLYTVKSDF